MSRPFAKLDPLERHYRIPSHLEDLELFLCHLPSTKVASGAPKIVLYVHGGTFPSALSIAHRFDGRSWRDELTDAGFEVWGLDFLGFGNSDRYPEMSAPAEESGVLGGAESASWQIEAAVRFIADRHGSARVSIIAHSWGCIATGCFAARRPELVERLVFFGPVTWRAPKADAPRYGAWRLVSIEDQWKRFTEDVPADEPAVLSPRHFEEWARSYLATDPESAARTPPSVKVPSGPWADIADAWSGRLAYDPAAIRAPIAILRGEWDSLITDTDAQWLFDKLKASPLRRDVKLARATHLMHLEEGRYALYREAQLFLEGNDRPREATPAATSLDMEDACSR